MRPFGSPRGTRTETKLVHGELVRVTVCRPGHAKGAGKGGYNSTHSRYHLADLAEQGPLPRRVHIAVDPDDARSQHWLLKSRNKHRMEKKLGIKFELRGASPSRKLT